MAEEASQETAAQLNKKAGFGKRLGRFFGITLIVLALAYVAAAFYMTEHFFPFTKINGVDVSLMNVDRAKSALESSIRNYKLGIEDPRYDTEYVDVSAAGIEVKSLEAVDSLREAQNPCLWGTSLYSPEEYTVEDMFEADRDGLFEAVSELSSVKAGRGNRPINAYVYYDMDKGQFEIKAERYGEYIDPEVLTDVLLTTAARHGEVHNIPEMGGYAQPKVLKTDEKLSSDRDALNGYLDAEITYDLGSKSFTLDKGMYHDWLYVRDDGVVDLSEMKLRNYVESMAAKYDTYGDERNITTSYGTTVTLKSKNYGWKIDQLSEMERVSNDILDHHVVTRDFEYEQVAASHDNVDLGNSYVEINLTRQHLFLYKDGVRLLDTDVVTGNLRTGCKTPGGIYKINFMNRDRYLTGDTYRTFVHYWMPFNKGIGLHDATWRSQFGGEIYKTSGSHGCVNMPLEMAQAVYEAVEPGYMVICYWEDES